MNLYATKLLIVAAADKSDNKTTRFYLQELTSLNIIEIPRELYDIFATYSDKLLEMARDLKQLDDGSTLISSFVDEKAKKLLECARWFAGHMPYIFKYRVPGSWKCEEIYCEPNAVDPVIINRIKNINNISL